MDSTRKLFEEAERTSERPSLRSSRPSNSGASRRCRPAAELLSCYLQSMRSPEDQNRDTVHLLRIGAWERASELDEILQKYGPFFLEG